MQYSKSYTEEEIAEMDAIQYFENLAISEDQQQKELERNREENRQIMLDMQIDALEREWFNHQTRFVEICLHQGLIDSTSFKNIRVDDKMTKTKTPAYVSIKDGQKINEWFCVPSWVGEKLCSYQEPVIVCNNGSSVWWGQTTPCFLLNKHPLILKIFNDFGWSMYGDEFGLIIGSAIGPQQTSLVNTLFKNGIFKLVDTLNDDSLDKPLMTLFSNGWWKPVQPWLRKELIKRGEVILHNEHGSWWFEQKTPDDQNGYPVLAQIYQNIYID